MGRRISLTRPSVSSWKRAAVWIGLVVLVALVAMLAQPILLIIGGIVIAAMLDGGTRLLGRALPIPRGFRLAIVIVAIIGFFYWMVMLTGSQLAQQAAALGGVLETQINNIGDRIQRAGFAVSAEDIKSIGSQIISSVGRVTAAVNLLCRNNGQYGDDAPVLGVFIAIEPRLYERGVGWDAALDQSASIFTAPWRKSDIRCAG